MIENIPSKKILTFFWPFLQIITFAFFTKVVIEQVEMGLVNPAYFLLLFSSYSLLFIGSLFDYKNLNKAKYFLGASLITGLISLYTWQTLIALAFVTPSFAQIFIVFSKRKNEALPMVSLTIFWIFGFLTVIGFAYLDQYKAMGNVKTLLNDPESASFRNLRDLTHYSKSIVCGEVNAKNKLGGYTGFTKFIVISNQALISNENDSRLENDENLTRSCEQLFYLLQEKELLVHLK